MTFLPLVRRMSGTLFALIVLVSCASVTLPTAQNGAHKDADGLSPAAARLRVDIAYLSDDSMRGRDTGSAEYDRAAAYVADRFKALGLKPAGDADSYFQVVPLARLKRNMDDATMRLVTADGGNHSLESGTDFIISFPPNGISEDVMAPVIFVGYGITAPR